jgi:phage shock protein PspC (stress-responsive transcriptional regulator)
MQKVVGINLNGNAYQLEEPGYEALRVYLERAENRLRTNPDRAEIMADLEQAIAEKCGRYLGPNKTVVTAAEIETLIAEMGPVESPEASAEGGDPSANAGAAADEGRRDAPKDTRRRLYQIREGAMLSGVCNGLAAFLDIDVTVVRLLFVIITFATFGAWILAYIVMAIFIPYADTAEDRAAAYGLRLKAQEFLDQANLHHARARREWRRHWRRQQRAWQRSWGERWQRQWDQRWQQHMAQQSQAAMAASAAPIPVVAQALAGMALPVFAVINAAVFVTWILLVLSAVMTRTLFGWPLPEGMPLWGALLALSAIYIGVVAPLSAARHGARHAWGPYYAPWAAISGLFWVAFTMLFFWLAYQHIPQVHALLDQLPAFFQKRQISLALLDI